MDSIKLIVMTPQQTLIDASVSAVCLPGVEGRFEVLHNHAPLITALSAGVMWYQSDAEGRKELEIESGFVEVLENKVTVCAETK